MSYKEKVILKLYTFENNSFKLQAQIDDYEEVSFTDNIYESGDFTITINYNIPNALKFSRGMFIQFGNNEYRFGEIHKISDSIGEDGKGSQVRIISGKDARYIFKRRIIRNLNNVENWSLMAKGELCLRELIDDQCGSNAEVKRRLPIINQIPSAENAIGDVYNVSESFSNLYDALVTIATQSKVGWRLKFINNALTLECYEGTDRSSTVQFSTDFETLANGEFTDSSESYANTVYVAGKGTGSDRDIYEGEQEISGESPSGLDRFEAFDNQSSMTTEEEYEAEAISMLNQYGQTLQLAGNGLAECPYKYREQYFVGDIITVAFSGKSAKVQILSVTENWNGRGGYGIEFAFGKPQPDLNKQLELMLKKIQKASNKTSSTNSVRWYTIPTDTDMPSSDVTYDTIGFIGECASGGSTFQLYLDNQKTGAKTYHVYFKQLAGGKLTLTTGKEGATDLVMNSGTYVAIIYVDAQGNVTMAGATVTNTIEAGNTQPPSSEAVYQAIQGGGGGSSKGMPLGTWASFEGGVAPNDEWLEAGTTFDPNTYPALYNILGTNVVPERFDHSQLGDMESISIPESSATHLKVPYDGFIILQNQANTLGYFYIKTPNATVRTYIFSNSSSYYQNTIPIRKGDEVYRIGSFGSASVRYYKQHLFIKATPTASETDFNAIKAYVQNANSYSTEEKLTGGTWVDGRPIYTKTYTNLNIRATSTLIDTITDIDKIISSKCWATYYTDTNQTTVSYYETSDGSGVFSGYVYLFPNKQIKAYSGSGLRRVTDVTIEYTKSTDTPTS